ncbi:hypothetical protein Bbelb_391640 [Branchiostoma belcheri]|nr:hypothetical protein Bbelb_391640 [Branchiostoma belcheri]
MCTGFSEDLREIDNMRKTAIIDRELTRLDISIAALQENLTFFWKGREPNEPRQHGVGFAVRNTLLAAVEPPTGGTERLLSLRLSTDAGHVNILSVYAPTLKSPKDKKDKFYEQLHEMVASCQKDEPLFLLGNARVGTDHESWRTYLGHHGRMNGNGQRLLELCASHGTKFPWEHPRSHHWHQLDLIITRRTALNSVLRTRSYHSADCDTDHALVSSRVRFKPRNLYRSRPKGSPRINVAHMSLPNRVTEYVSRLDQALQQMPHDAHGATTRWKAIQDVIHKTAIATFGIQKSAESGDLRGMNNGIKKALGPTVKKTAPLKSLSGVKITELSDYVLNSIEDLSILEELDAVPTVEELSIAIDSLPCGKAPGSDNIPPKAIKQWKPALLRPLYDLLCLRWEEGAVPQDLRDATIVTLYKNKGHRGDCNNYRGISLLNIVGQLYARIHLYRLKILADRVYPESQCGFRAKRSTTDMVFSLPPSKHGALPTLVRLCRPGRVLWGEEFDNRGTLAYSAYAIRRGPPNAASAGLGMSGVWRTDGSRRMFCMELTSGSREVGRPALRYKDICKRDMKSCGISTDTWEAQAEHRAAWRRVVQNGVADSDKRRGEAAAEERRLRKAAAQTAPLRTHHTCGVCRRVCKTKAGLSSHMRSHQRRQDRLNCQRGI